MEDDDDIFSSVKEFCRDDKMGFTFNNATNLNPIISVNDNIFEPLNDSDQLPDDFSTLIRPSTSTKTSVNRATRSQTRANNKANENTSTVVPVASVDQEAQDSSNVTNTGRTRRTRATNNKNKDTLVNKNKSKGNTRNGRQTKQTQSSNISTTPSVNSLSNLDHLQGGISPILRSILEQTLSPFRTSRRRSKSRTSVQKSTYKRASRGRSNRNSTVASQQQQQQQSLSTTRNYVREVAARAQVVDYVDLVTSPVVLPQISGTIDLDSDKEQEKDGSNDFSFDNMEELERTSLSVKVKWGEKIVTFPYRKFQKFSDIIKHFAEIEKVNKENICLNLGDRIISEDDTPDSIDYEVHMFIQGRMVKDNINSLISQNVKDPNLIEVKIQCDGIKHPIMMTLKKSNTFSIIYAKCAEEFKVPVSSIKLSFDGEPLKANSNPKELDFEGGEIIDCRIQR